MRVLKIYPRSRRRHISAQARVAKPVWFSARCSQRTARCRKPLGHSTVSSTTEYTAATTLVPQPSPVIMPTRPKSEEGSLLGLPNPYAAPAQQPGQAVRSSAHAGGPPLRPTAGATPGDSGGLATGCSEKVTS